MTNSLRRRPGWKWGDRRQTKGGEADAGLSGDAYGRRQRGRSDLVMIGWVAAVFLAINVRFRGDRHGCFVFLHVRKHVFCCLDEFNRETKDVVAFLKLSPMPLRREITGKIHSFGFLLCFKGSKWPGCFNCKIGDERS